MRAGGAMTIGKAMALCARTETRRDAAPRSHAHARARAQRPADPPGCVPCAVHHHRRRSVRETCLDTASPFEDQTGGVSMPLSEIIQPPLQKMTQNFLNIVFTRL